MDFPVESRVHLKSLWLDIFHAFFIVKEAMLVHFASANQLQRVGSVILLRHYVIALSHLPLSWPIIFLHSYTLRHDCKCKNVCAKNNLSELFQ